MKNEIDELYRVDEGWGKPGHSDEEHYFVGTVSLCGKWALFSSTLRKHPDLVFPACQECKVRLDSEKIDTLLPTIRKHIEKHYPIEKL